MSKRTLYKQAVLLENNDEGSAPRKNLPSPLSFSRDPFSRSLSLSSDLESSSEGTLVTSKIATPDVTISGKPVVVIQTLDSHDLTTTAVPISTISVPSPVSVVRHHHPMEGPPPPPPFDRRFSSNFINSSGKGKKAEEVSGKTKEKMKDMERSEDEERAKGEDKRDRNDTDRQHVKQISLSSHLDVSGNSSATSSDEEIALSSTNIRGRRLEAVVEEELIGERENAHDDNNLTDNNTKHSASSTTKSKKNSKVRFIPSRYKSAADNVKRSHQPLTAERVKQSTDNRKSLKNNSTRLKSVLQDSSLNITTCSSNMSFNPLAHGRTTSTPNNSKETQQRGGADHVIKAPLDTQELFTSNLKSNPRGPSHSRKPLTKKTVSQPSTLSTTRRPAPTNAPTTQSLLDIRLLQMTYLHVKLSNAIQTQEKDASAQLYSLWEAYEKQKKEINELEKAIEREQRRQAVDLSAGVQMNGLIPLCEQLKDIKEDHTTLYRSLSSTLNELPTKNIQALNQDELEESLSVAQDVSSQISDMIEVPVTQVSSLADCVSQLSIAVEKEQHELKKVWSQIKKVTKLQVHESSLYFETEQRRDSTNVINVTSLIDNINDQEIFSS
jgi:hypothetical protein